LEKKKYVYVRGELVPVSEEVYLCYYQMARRERTLTEKDGRNGLLSYDALDTAALRGADMIRDRASPPEDAVINKIMVQRLRECFTELTEKERDLIRALFFEGKSVTQLSEELKIPRRTLGYRRDCVIRKLRRLMDV